MRKAWQGPRRRTALCARTLCGRLATCSGCSGMSRGRSCSTKKACYSRQNLAARRALPTHYCSLGREVESLAIFEEIGDEIGIASAQHHLGGRALEAGDYSRARGAFEQAVSIRRRVASSSNLTASLHSLGDCALLDGRLSDASTHYRESLRLALEIQSPRQIAYCLAGLASVAALEGRPEVAGFLWAATESIERELGFQLLGSERERYERLLPEADRHRSR